MKPINNLLIGFTSFFNLNYYIVTGNMFSGIRNAFGTSKKADLSREWNMERTPATL